MVSDHERLILRYSARNALAETPGLPTHKQSFNFSLKICRCFIISKKNFPLD